MFVETRENDEVLPKRQRRLPEGRRKGQEEAQRSHRREELCSTHAPFSVSVLCFYYLLIF